MDNLIGILVAAYFVWATLLPIAAAVTGLSGRTQLLVVLAGIELLLMIALLLLPTLLGEGWGSQGRAKHLILSTFLASVAMAVAAHALLAWIRKRRS